VGVKIDFLQHVIKFSGGRDFVQRGSPSNLPLKYSPGGRPRGMGDPNRCAVIVISFMGLQYYSYSKNPIRLNPDFRSQIAKSGVWQKTSICPFLVKMFSMGIS